VAAFSQRAGLRPRFADAHLCPYFPNLLSGLLARLAAKVAAYTCGQLLNAWIGRPLRHLASLLDLSNRKADVLG
jgi:hypothetical protein